MAIVVDPDNLDRQQVIFGTNTQKLSVYPVGGLRFNSAADGDVTISSANFNSVTHAFAAGDVGDHIIIQTGNNIGSYEITAFTDASNVTVDKVFSATESSITFTVASGETTGTTTFTDLNATFQTDSVAVGDILALYSGADAGHYRIASIPTETTLTVDIFTGFANFGTSTEQLAYTVQLSTGGTAADGATLQAAYSFGKEEWRTDSMTFAGDDAIKHEFPFEAITSEQFEIGGGAAHFDWAWHAGPLDTDTVVHYIRTGGWAAKDNANTTDNEFAGIITLGSIDADAQVYYQQVDANEPPQDFVLTGPVNQSILTWELANNYRTYLKLFVRKKGRTYSGSEISDIGVSTIQTIVNRFPLAHSLDSVISDTDGDIVATTPFTNAVVSRTLTGTGTDGVTIAGTGIFTAATATFQTDGVVPGDALSLVSGAAAADLGNWHILSVDSETQLTVSIADLTFTGDTVITFTVDTNVIISPATDGALADVDLVTGTLTSVTGGFTAAAIAADDLVVITEAASDHRGVYKVISNDSDTQLTLDTTDKAFTTQTAIDFYVTEPAMQLQYKWEDVTDSGTNTTGDLTFANVDPDTITRASGDWAADGVIIGDIINIIGSVSNDGNYTVAGVTTLVLTLVATDTLIAEGPVTVTSTVNRGFTRSIGGVFYAYKWRLLGNNASAADCYQFVQHQLRQTSDIDWGPGISRGDVTDLLFAYSTPTGTTNDMIIDDISSADLNNVTFTDATGFGRLFPFVAAGSLNFNGNLQDDTDAKYWMFFTNDDAGDNTGRDYGTKNAIIVLDASETPVDIAGAVGGSPSVSFTFDYDGNIQRGALSAGEDAPITIIAIGLNTAQFVITTGSITRSKANNFSLVSNLERNYSNP